jgi:hypothetical protein
MEKFKKVKSFAEAKKDIRVSDAFSEMGNIEDGKPDYWINLKEGYICESMECGTIHEATIKECLWLLNNDVVKVNND